MANRSRVALILFGIAALVLAACGGSGDAAQNGPLDIAVTGSDDFRFNPATITVQAGQQVNLTFENAGAVEHTFNILKADAELEHVVGETDEEHLHEELLFDIHEVAPGESETEPFTAPSEPGDYVIACLLPGHADAGMVGTLTVTP